MFTTNLTKSYPEAITFLTNSILKNKLANSYIFIGKDTEDILAIVINLAKILNCEKNKGGIPCENCINCKWLERKEHPQALLIITPDIKSKKEQIKIDVIRELLNNLKLTSEYYKVVFFDNADLNSLSRECCNLLLKTVEETPEKIIFIFASPTKNDILPTIASRSQTIYLNKKENLSKDLINIKNKNILDEILTNCYSDKMQQSIEKAKKTFEYLEKQGVNVKDYLTSMASTNYELHKHSNQRKYCYLYEKLSNAYLKHKSFMQNKIVLEDLFLELTAQ